MKLKQIWSLLLLTLTVTFFGTGCAYVQRGGTPNTTTITSAPTGAWVTINGKHEGYTPFQVRLHPKDKFTIEVGHDGYRTARFISNSSVDGIGAGSFIADLGGFVLGPVGLITTGIDLGTGANRAHIPTLNINLEPGIGYSAPTASAVAYVPTVPQTPPVPALPPTPVVPPPAPVVVNTNPPPPFILAEGFICPKCNVKFFPKTVSVACPNCDYKGR